MPLSTTITKTILINAPASVVWLHLTTPDLMKQWMLDTDMEMDIITDWTVGSPIRMKGVMHGIDFENTGTILTYDPDKTLQYSHLSSLSCLPDTTENQCVLTFTLTPIETQIRLTLTITNFPTEAILRHLDFYWRTAVEVLKRLIEKNSVDQSIQQ
ncbi:SRPBCC domain-containing protein [Spirosoma sp. HMF3257]|uniref:SRPBCC domain-containing protein n=1 Tax=Spirosoma telluris TaxID=2183553 RepID=A0A327NRI9_9BACT|nr:SRPBCC domain-containing protein [Spirosoma telluris]RAI75338.1 SRPBCC domain-containing protein [Spirosoma telluris]